MLNRKANAYKAPAQERDKDRIAAGPCAIQGKPGAATTTPNPPAPEPNGRRPDLDAFNLAQRHVLVSAERKIVTTENDLSISNLNETIFV
jgi:hypothetical protein